MQVEAANQNAEGHPRADPGQEQDQGDWVWRARIRGNPKSRVIYRVLVAVVGTAVTALGLILIPAPGPGWLVVFLGLAVLASEFTWAERLLLFARREVGRWTTWAIRQPLPVRLLLGLGSFAILLCALWVSLRLFGVPGLVPHSWVPGWTGLHR